MSAENIQLPYIGPEIADTYDRLEQEYLTSLFSAVTASYYALANIDPAARARAFSEIYPGQEAQLQDPQVYRQVHYDLITPSDSEDRQFFYAALSSHYNTGHLLELQQFAGEPRVELTLAQPETETDPDSFPYIRRYNQTFWYFAHRLPESVQLFIELENLFLASYLRNKSEFDNPTGIDAELDTEPFVTSEIELELETEPEQSNSPTRIQKMHLRRTHSRPITPRRQKVAEHLLARGVDPASILPASRR